MPVPNLAPANQDILAETLRGKLLTIHVYTVPRDCVIGLSGNGYWQERGTYSPGAVVFERDAYGPKLGRHAHVEEVGWFYNLADILYFYGSRMDDPITSYVLC